MKFKERFTGEEWEQVWREIEQDYAQQFLHTIRPEQLHSELQMARTLKAWFEERENV